MKIATFIIFIVCISPTHVVEATYYCSGTDDPCTQASTLFEPYARTENCKHDGVHSPCDRYITPRWYVTDNPILDQCPDLLSCGAVYPVWFNGSFPSVGDGITTEQLCKTGFSDCCSRTYDIQIKNCGTHYVYCLPALDACPERICFGTNGSCEYPTTTAPTTLKSKNVPSKTFNDLKSRYGLAIGSVVVLVLILIAVGGVVGLYIYKKKKHEREVSQSRIVLVEEESHQGTPRMEESNRAMTPVGGHSAPPYLNFQLSKSRQ
ncbi:oncoprotein-induced transcript 3 protein-like [Ostrea edulis]|uniref:oncoprotein-induced transcript 3 protein-like n=1 Tax=Ostrea edulis TaxID=37623 RepID=UPI0024AF9E2F|nr:oncoprotein-induced transcript 3 protein-like [Ostrea edulis]XP_048767404.2 oncoprotein-induced transcript 3 protein-like [Ostrea edulis]